MHIFLNLSNDAAFGHLSGLADGVVDGLGVGGAVGDCVRYLYNKLN